MTIEQKTHRARLQRERLSANPALREKHNKYTRHWRAANKDKVRDYKRAYTPGYLERRLKARIALHGPLRILNRGDKPQNNERQKRYRRENVWNVRFSQGLHHARRLAVPIGDLDALRYFYKAVFAHPVAICEYCELEFPIKQITIDHKRAFKLGGIHEAGNLAVCCCNCNVKKGIKPLETWLQKVSKA